MTKKEIFKTAIIFSTIFNLPSVSYADVYHEKQSNKQLLEASDPYYLIDPSITVLLQLGGFSASQGEDQNIQIDGLVGNRYNVTDQTDQNVLVGLGIYADTYSSERWKILLGMNAFYLAQTFVSGEVVQEQLFTNLSYRYGVVNFPVYFAGRALYKLPNDKYSFVLDLGLGLNIIQTGNVSESSLDGGVTIPDYLFSGDSNVSWSGTVGLGIRCNRLFRKIPVEVGYRFFYLGEGGFDSRYSSAVPVALTTGHSYANALVFTANI